MEKLLHYVWQHRLLPPHPLFTTNGEQVEVIDPGLHNDNAGPDFTAAKVRVGGMLWIGNVEIHLRASDWFRHRHDSDPAYDNVVLHVIADNDMEVYTHAGNIPPQVVIPIPQPLHDNFRELASEANYPPCYRVIPALPALTIHGYLNVLTAERLQEKTERIQALAARLGGDWERTCFVTLARSFGFGINAEAFAEWAERLSPVAMARHRDNLRQIEALFFGTAGWLNAEAVATEKQDDEFRALAAEYRFLAAKFSLTPLSHSVWRLLRLRPQNFPTVRIAQLCTLFHSRRGSLSQLLEAENAEALRKLLAVSVTPYWQTHYTLGGKPSQPSAKTLQRASLDLILINAVAPLFFAYGKHRHDEALCDRALALLEALPAERNHITRAWSEVGLTAQNAADSQALLHLRTHLCDRKDCLRCRIGSEYLRRND